MILNAYLITFCVSQRGHILHQCMLGYSLLMSLNVRNLLLMVNESQGVNCLCVAIHHNNDLVTQPMK